MQLLTFLYKNVFMYHLASSQTPPVVRGPPSIYPGQSLGVGISVFLFPSSAFLFPLARLSEHSG